jgi:hypothetical protein
MDGNVDVSVGAFVLCTAKSEWDTNEIVDIAVNHYHYSLRVVAGRLDVRQSVSLCR